MDLSPETWRKWTPYRLALLWTGWGLVWLAFMLPAEAGSGWLTFLRIGGLWLLLPLAAVFDPGTLVLVPVPVITVLALVSPRWALRHSPHVRWIGPTLVVAGVGALVAPAVTGGQFWVLTVTIAAGYSPASVTWAVGLILTGLGVIAAGLTVVVRQSWRGCPVCGYDLLGSLLGEGETCPECGEPISRETRTRFAKMVDTSGRDALERRLLGARTRSNGRKDDE